VVEVLAEGLILCITTLAEIGVAIGTIFLAAVTFVTLREDIKKSEIQAKKEILGSVPNFL
jgi:hypothetical protein